jgi:hypothetical protein
VITDCPFPLIGHCLPSGVLFLIPLLFVCVLLCYGLKASRAARLEKHLLEAITFTQVPTTHHSHTQHTQKGDVQASLLSICTYNMYCTYLIIII